MKNFVCKVLGDNIKRLRKLKGLKQDELAEQIGIEVKSLSLIETGNGFASAKTLEKLMSILNVPISELFYSCDDTDTDAIYKRIIETLNLIKTNPAKLNTALLLVKSLL